MTKLTLKTKKIAFMCAKCFTTSVDKLAWFVGQSLWNESFLCRTCWSESFNKLTERERKEWGFYATKK